MHRRLNAFTVLELALSIAILAIVSTLLGVSVQRARIKVKALNCRNNLAQQGRFLIDFVSTHGVYPLSGNKDGKYPEHKLAWFATIFPINASGEYTFSCPSALRPPGPRSQGFSHYGYNDRGVVGKYEDSPLGLGGNGQWPYRPPPVSEASIETPTSMIAILDAAQSWNGLIEDGLTSYSGRYFYSWGSVDGNMRMQRRHHGNIQIVFCDGHVGNELLSDIYVNESKRGLAMWNRDGLPHLERLR